MHLLASRFYGDRSWKFQLARYVSIGLLVTALDVGSFALFLRARWPLMLAVTASYGLGVAIHFSLNKYANFRAHDRPVRRQAINYAVVAVTCWVTTAAIVKLAVGFGIAPLPAKLIAIACNVPFGFLGHRNLSFGRGITATLRSLFSRTPETPQ
jgi:putative flippase GtrA